MKKPLVLFQYQHVHARATFEQHTQALIEQLQELFPELVSTTFHIGQEHQHSIKISLDAHLKQHQYFHAEHTLSSDESLEQAAERLIEKFEHWVEHRHRSRHV